MQERYVDIHTHKPQDNAIYVLSCSIEQEDKPADGGLFSVGIHPWQAGSVDLPKALHYLGTVHVAAIGEIGLDYVHDVDRQIQKNIFEAQLSVAEKRRLPVIIHCVKAYNDVVNILNNYKLRSVIFHGYIGSPQQTETIISKGYYISVGAGSLRSPKTVESLRQIPLDRLFIETDTNDIDIADLYSNVAGILDIPPDNLIEIINENFNGIFK